MTGGVVGVIGATGGIGSEVTRQLVDRGVAVRAMVRDEARARASLGSRPSFAVVDLDDPGTFEAAFTGVRSLFLLSPVGPQMVARQKRAVDAAVAAGVERVVRISSIAVGDPEMPMRFAGWHADIDAHLTSSGLGWTVLRPSNFARNLLGFAPTVRATGELRAPLGDGRMCFVDDADIAAVAVLALTDHGHRGCTYVLTGSEWLSFAEVAALMGDVTGAPVRYVSVSIERARESWRRAGHDDWFLDDLSVMYERLSVSTVSPVHPDVSTLLGRPPRDLRSFILEHTAAFAPEGTRVP